MAIIAILVLLASPKFLNQTAEAKEIQIKNDIKVTENALEGYMLKNSDKLPNDLEFKDKAEVEESLAEVKVYDYTGIVKAIKGDKFYVLKDIGNSKLKGEFVANENGKVYYISDKASKDNDGPDTEGFIFNEETLTITGYEGEVPKDLVIPAQIKKNGKLYEVKTIGDEAFKSKSLTSVVIPDSVTSIEEWAFYSNQLTNVVIPNSVTTIGYYAFEGNELTSVEIGNSVTTIGNHAFYDNRLTSIVIPDSVTTIGKYAFSYNELTNVEIPNSVTTIGESAFSWNKLTSIVIPDSVTTIGEKAFAYNKLTNVVIPNSVTSIGESAFNFNNLTSITIGSNVDIDDNFLNLSNNNFRDAYEANNKAAGTYIGTQEGTWTKQ